MERLDNMCVEKIKVSRNLVFSQEAEHCHNCNGLNYECEFYLSVKNTELGVRKGVYAFELMRR